MAGVAASASRDSSVAGRLRGRSHRPAIVIGVALVCLGLVCFLDLSYGAVNLGPREVWAGLTGDSDAYARAVVWEIRFPRFLDSMAVGASLAIAGVLLQGVCPVPGVRR